jgi:ribosome-binding factor A
MKFKKPSQRQIRSACHEIGPDDGVDPRTQFPRPGRRRSSRKALQLRGQIARTLSVVLAYESGDDLLRNLTVTAVEPAPNSTRVLVTVCLEAPAAAVDLGEILERLQRASGKLRTEVAAAIHRKRVPELVFRVLRRKEAGS